MQDPRLIMLLCAGAMFVGITWIAGGYRVIRARNDVDLGEYLDMQDRWARNQALVTWAGMTVFFITVLLIEKSEPGVVWPLMAFDVVILGPVLLLATNMYKRMIFPRHKDDGVP